MKATIPDHVPGSVSIDTRGNEDVVRKSGAISAGEPFGNSLEHVLAELERIDLLIEAQVGRARQLHKDDEFQGLYISEQEVDALMAQPIGLPRWAALPPANADSDVRAAIGRLRGQIDARRKASIDNDIPLRLVNLANRFQLNWFDEEGRMISEKRVTDAAEIIRQILGPRANIQLFAYGAAAGREDMAPASLGNDQILVRIIAP